MNAAITRPLQIEPASPALLSEPLHFFFAEHFRQRQLFNCLDQLAAAETLDPDLAAAILAFMRNDMVLHLLDEQDLFPLMQQRCSPQDEIEPVVSVLLADHAGHRRQASKIIRGLEKAMAEAQPPQGYRGLGKAMRDFARKERRHLALENAVVLPLARLRLKAGDLDFLSRSLTARRVAAATDDGKTD
jgi:iron-sulfur cluster repair protein YtfE (RIC family)